MTSTDVTTVFLLANSVIWVLPGPVVETGDKLQNGRYRGTESTECIVVTIGKMKILFLHLK